MSRTTQRIEPRATGPARPATDSLLVRGGRVIDPASGHDAVADLLIVEGRIHTLGRAREPAAVTLDAAGLIVCPGLIDMHVHLREPGNEEEETIASGTAAAVAGGFTSVACMPNTQPPLDNEGAIESIFRQAARSASCNVFPIGALTKGRAGRELAEMGQMVRAGAVAFSDDGCGIASSAVMLRALQYAGMFGRTVIQHCEDAELAAGGCMHAGPTATRLGLPGIAAAAEELMVQRDLLLAGLTGTRYHVAHISTRTAVRLVREAKAAGAPVSAEVTPHHLLLTDEACATFDTRFKVNPPLRSAADVEACVAGVVDGTIDCLCTDHAPHAADEKALDFPAAPFGMVGLESAVATSLRALVEPGRIDWPRWVALWTINPARALQIDRGTLAPGAVADVTVIDPQEAWTIDPAAFRSLSRNTPFAGWSVLGRAVLTLVAGRPKYCGREPWREWAKESGGC
ncbi:MAG: dihydroorotase [Phycisphaerae bacterium]